MLDTLATDMVLFVERTDIGGLGGADEAAAEELAEAALADAALADAMALATSFETGTDCFFGDIASRRKKY
jgi:hypothetical protein